jgi:hypothetical protein
METICITLTQGSVEITNNWSFLINLNVVLKPTHELLAASYTGYYYDIYDAAKLFSFLLFSIDRRPPRPTSVSGTALQLCGISTKLNTL